MLGIWAISVHSLLCTGHVSLQGIRLFLSLARTACLRLWARYFQRQLLVDVSKCIPLRQHILQFLPHLTTNAACPSECSS